MNQPVKSIIVITIAAALSLAASAQAADMQRSGFFDNYDKLQPAEASWVDFLYTSERMEQLLGSARAIVVPQPEIFLAGDSKYKGISPDEMKALADTFQSVVIEALADKYQIAQRPGPDTIVLRMALSNVHLKRKGRNLLGYTPIGFVVTTTKRMLDEFTKKILLTEVTWEGEFVDGETGEVVGQIIVAMGNNSKKKEFTSWDDLVTAMSVGALRLRCRFDNAGAGTTRDCLSITDVDLADR